MYKTIANHIRGLSRAAKDRRKLAAARAREEAFASVDWAQEDGVARRRYRSYDDYLRHQASKLDDVEGQLRRREDKDLTSFVERFATCAALQDARSVLCLGARLGTEVRALHQLGKFAIGIDLNPGERNELVLHGDFHRLVFPDASVDAVYSNAFDHAFDLERVVGEAGRLLRPGGVLVTDLLSGFEEGFTPGEYEALHWRDIELIVERIRAAGGLSVEEQRPLDPVRSSQWVQVVFRKPEAAAGPAASDIEEQVLALP